ncbi:putative protein YfgD [Vibrio stylophorae]|uniref:Arsenate reductase n=2 Tax=Vibrio stylophorae TaxID=659351 RepID=A0ABN8DTU3_9VIBR|nr:putative protein YfgD [Vibrio stylophorae]
MTQIYHNPRCSKSRETLALLQEHHIEVEEIRYLDTPPTAATIESLLKALGFDSARQLMRQKEELYKTLNLANEQNEDALIAAMIANPKLIERPIVVHGEKAAIGRPPAQVLALFA